jgi:hypothetical protein
MNTFMMNLLFKDISTLNFNRALLRFKLWYNPINPFLSLPESIRIQVPLFSMSWIFPSSSRHPQDYKIFSYPKKQRVKAKTNYLDTLSGYVFKIFLAKHDTHSKFIKAVVCVNQRFSTKFSFCLNIQKQ